MFKRAQVASEWEAVVWVNQEGSMTTYRATELEASKAAEEMRSQAEIAGWDVRSIEVVPVDADRRRIEL